MKGCKNKRQGNNETDNEPNDGSDLFEKFDGKISWWTPPDGQFSVADHYIDRCRRFHGPLTGFQKITRMPVSNANNLSLSEMKALRKIRRRTDVVMVTPSLHPRGQ